MSKKFILLIVSFAAILFIDSCSCHSVNQKNKDLINQAILEESEITVIPLKGEASNRSSEISGLCWYGERLILLPQYPNSFDSDLGMGKIFFIPKDKISNFLNGNDPSAILPEYFSIDLSNLKEHFSLGSGFESIIINNDIAYFTIESMNDGKTETILISGIIDSIKNTIKLDENSLIKDPSEIFIYNISDESILYYENKIIPIYEVFGKNINHNPKVSIFDTNLNFTKKVDFPSIEYRITDVTSVDENGKFWAINYLYPGDLKKLNPATDPFITNFGIGKTHFRSKPVERLVQFQIINDKIMLLDQAPTYLKLLENNSRNWEGIARFEDKGLLLITDTFPETIFAFVKAKKQ